jgi:DNA (cytosine-5)-methyltransferase 1
MVQTGYGEREGQAPRALDIEAPIRTQVTAGGKHAIVAAWMVQHNLGVIGHHAQDPVSTLTTAGTQQQVASSYLVKLRGTCTGQRADDPVPTLSAGGNHVAAVAAFMTKYYSQGGVTHGMDEPLHTLSTKARFAPVTAMIEGTPYAVADIGMRMLEPHEAAAAHELHLPKRITLDGKTRPLTKSECMRLIGNSVPKRMAYLLARENIQHALTGANVARAA